MKIDKDIRILLSQEFGGVDWIEVQEDYYRIKIGKIIGAGCFSIAIDLDMPFIPQEIKESFNEAILIITLEKEKPEMLKAILDSKIQMIDIEKSIEEDKGEWLEYVEYETEEEANEDGVFFNWYEYSSEFNIYPYLQRLQDEYGVISFFMEKGKQKAFTEREETIMEEVFDYFKSCLPSTTINASHIECYIKNIFKEDIEEALKESFRKKKDIEMAIDYFHILKRDISEMGVAVGEKPVYLDMHTGQFLEFENKLYMTDAFVL